MKMSQFRRSYGGEGPLDTKHWDVLAAVADKLEPLYPAPVPVDEDEGKKSAKGQNENDRNNSIRLLYPGSYCHLTPSMLFNHVHYVDSDKKVIEMMKSTDVSSKWMTEFGMANGSYDVTYADYTSFFADQQKSKKSAKQCKPPFHLIISMSAGIVTDAIGKTTWWVDNEITSDEHKPWLLVSDAHSDARRAFVDHADIWTLRAVWLDGELNEDPDVLDKCFRVIPKGKGRKRKQSQTTKTTKKKKADDSEQGDDAKDDEGSKGGNDDDEETPFITKEQVEESIAIGSTSKRSFRMVVDAMFFLFQRK